MKRVIWFMVVAFVCASALFIAFSPQLEVKRKAFGDVVGRLFDKPNHPLIVVESSGRLVTARYNLSVITRATEYIATLGSNTVVYRELVRIAAAADCECPRLEKVLDLAVVCQSDADRILRLAEAACRIDTPAQEEAWQREFDALWSSAEYLSVEEALKAMKTH